MVQVALAEDVTEAEELRAILHAAGIESELETAVDHHPRATDDVRQKTLVAEGDLLARRVLDVGCGTGNLAAALAARGARVWGVDPSPEMLAIARRKAPRGAGFREGRAEALPFRDGWFDRAALVLVAHL